MCSVYYKSCHCAARWFTHLTRFLPLHTLPLLDFTLCSSQAHESLARSAVGALATVVPPLRDLVRIIAWCLKRWTNSPGFLVLDESSLSVCFPLHLYALCCMVLRKVLGLQSFFFVFCLFVFFFYPHVRLLQAKNKVHLLRETSGSLQSQLR